jgi:hypothetical protein
MIIRRKHTANFTIVTNEAINDKRLSLEERFALVWLLSRPHDWEVSRAACAKLWGVGRDKARRILRRLAETGWAKGEMMRDESTGTFIGMRYTVTDECGPEQVFREDDGEPVIAAEPASEVVAEPDTDLEPGPEKASVDDHHALKTHPLENQAPAPLLSTESTKIPPTPQGGEVREPPKADEAEARASFERFRREREPHPIEHEAKCWAIWLRLSPVDREIRIKAISVWAIEQRKRSKTSTPKAAHTWLGEGTERSPGLWQGYWATAQGRGSTGTAAGSYDPRGDAGRAITTLCRIARYSPLRTRDGAIMYRHQLTPRLLALAGAPPEAAWITYAGGSNQFGAWRRFIGEALAGAALQVLTEIRAPWPWPPRVDGSLSATDATGPPDTLMTAEDDETLTRGL